jgi:hypothetical protein
MTRGKRAISGERRFRGRGSWRRESQLVEAFTKPVFEGHRGQGPNCPNYNSNGPVSVRGSILVGGVFRELFSRAAITTSPRYCDAKLQLVAGKCPSYGAERNQGWRCARSVSSKGNLRGAEGRRRSARNESDSHNQRLERKIRSAIGFLCEHRCQASKRERFGRGQTRRHCRRDQD